MRKAEMEVTKAENMVEHGDEIFAKPARTWFQTPREKKEIALAEKAKADGNAPQGKSKQEREAEKNALKRKRGAEKDTLGPRKASKLMQVRWLPIILLVFHERIFYQQDPVMSQCQSGNLLLQTRSMGNALPSVPPALSLPAVHNSFPALPALQCSPNCNCEVCTMVSKYAYLSGNASSFKGHTSHKDEAERITATGDAIRKGREGGRHANHRQSLVEESEEADGEGERRQAVSSGSAPVQGVCRRKEKWQIEIV